MLWLDGADANSITYGVSPKVSSWKDKSVNGYNATQGTAGNQPSFNGSGVVFNVASATSLTSTYTANPTNETVFVVINPTTITGGTFDIVSTTATGGREIYISTTNLVGTAAAGSAAACLGPTITATTKLIEMTYAGTAASILEYYNGAVQVDTGTNTTAFSGAGTTRIGAGPTTNYFAGTIYEIICYNTVLPVGQRQQVEGYLAWKWNLQASLPASHLYASSINRMPLSRTFLPIDIHGCQMWFDAADSSTISFSSGSTLSQWQDKSGNAYHAVPNTGSGTYSSTGLTGSLPTIGITVTGNMRSPVPAGTFPSNITLFVVFQKTGANTASDCVITRSGGAGGNIPAPIDFYSNAVSNGSYRFVGTGTTYQYSTGSSTEIAHRTTPTIYYANVTSSAPKVWNESVNGTFGTINLSNGTGTTYSDTASYVYIGSRADNASYMIGNISEIIMYNTTLTTSERQQLEGYLAHKWNLTTYLPATAPFKYYYPSTPTPFNPSLLSPILWMDASDSSTITGTTSVTLWADKSGNGCNMTNLFGTTSYDSNIKAIVNSASGSGMGTLASKLVPALSSGGVTGTICS